MKYYSEDVVRKIYEKALVVGIDEAISKAKSIELPDKYGRLIEADELEKAVEKMVICDSYEYTIAHEMIKKLLKIAPTVLEAST